ncbi:FAD-binding oxidoreductase [Pseudorhodoplanes sp.]|uniref:FAD-binding oxidoreductase n=1 Tax=Pseudorhodoplanes sp. TaxID=1934341 RepID=UPI003D09A364
MRAFVNDLKQQAIAPVFEPREEGYQSATRIFNSAIDTRPLAVLRCTKPEHIAAGIKAARKANVSISVRGGGHNSAGLALRGGGLLLDCSTWRDVHVDNELRRAKVSPGATWANFDLAAQQFGLATPGGVVSSTGVAGLSLGGGVGALRGRHGLACDNFRSINLVLANGSEVTASASENPDLFWALRGGASNFGIVTSFEFQLHPASRVVTGFLTYPIEEAEEVLHHFWQREKSIPDDCVFEFFFMYDQNGRAVVRVVPRFIGTEEESKPTLDPLRQFRNPEDNLREFSYCDSQSFLDAGSQWGFRSLWRTKTIKTYEPEFVSHIVDMIINAPSKRCMVIVEHFHGAVHRIADDSAAVGFRQAKFNLMMVGQWEKPAEDEAGAQWVKTLAARVAHLSGTGAYVNYFGPDATQDDVRNAYGAKKYARLQTIKLKYDPDNVFRCNQNILPATASPATSAEQQ